MGSMELSTAPENGTAAAYNGAVPPANGGVERRLRSSASSASSTSYPLLADYALSYSNVIMCVLYPAVMGISLAFHGGTMAWIKPTSETLPNKWRTTDGGSMAIMIMAFTLVSLINLHMTGTLAMVRVPEFPRMAPLYSWFAPFILWLFTTLYFIIYTDTDRYVTRTYQWAIAVVFPVLVMCGSIFLVWAPVEQVRVLRSQ